MKNLSLLYLLPMLWMLSCDDPREKVPLVMKYSWTDTIWNYRLSRTELVVSPADELKDKTWNFRAILHDSTNPWFTETDAFILTFEKNEIRFPIYIPDTIDIANVLPDIIGLPYNGILLHKSQGKTSYDMGQPVYFICRNQQLHVFNMENIQNLYYIPENLIAGKDSAFFRKKALDFYRDSM